MKFTLTSLLVAAIAIFLTWLSKSVGPDQSVEMNARVMKWRDQCNIAFEAKQITLFLKN